MTVFYFTGTGNSLFVARKIAEGGGGVVVSIPVAVAEQRAYSDDCIGFVYPQYAAGLPKMVRRFVLGNSFAAEYFFAVDLYAFIRAGALGEIAGLVPLNYGVYLKTPNNFTSALSPPKDPGAVLGRAEDRLAGIIGDIRDRREKRVRPRSSVGNATRYFGRSRFKVTEACVGCGLCARVCPADNIGLEGGVVFGERCESCYACANLCPEHAIYANGAMLRRRQYRNPFVTAEEIAEAYGRD